MNCIEFRHAVLTEPRAVSDAMAAHRTSCPGCAAYAERSERFEADLLTALRIETPPELADRILLRRSLADHDAERYPRRRFMALAASLALGTTALIAGGVWRARSRLEQDLLAHAAAPHPVGLGGGKGDVAPTLVEALVADVGADLHGVPGRVEDAWPCVMRGTRGAHLRLQGVQGLVSVMMLPQERIRSARRFGEGGSVGLMQPRPHGLLAIVGRAGEPLDEIAARLENVLTWA
jgi:hypothetical protein